ncbi:hypothetical protein BCEN4_2470007 [Burkholderia cenocepacia]|nr:hypothetical protein BCEN4_2470007 [Burkholderia cenocepacia]
MTPNAASCAPISQANKKILGTVSISVGVVRRSIGGVRIARPSRFSIRQPTEGATPCPCPSNRSRKGCAR